MNYKNLIQFLIISFFLVNCQASEEQSNPMNTGNDHTSESSILALGDSYTIGESVEVNERWPVQLKDSLITSGIEISDVKIVARTGWTTGELMNAIENQNITGPYKLVTLLIGVNNQYRGMDIEIFKSEFAQLLNLAIEFAGNSPERVVVLSIPDWGVTPFAEGRDQAAWRKPLQQALRKRLGALGSTPPECGLAAFQKRLPAPGPVAQGGTG